MQTHPRATLTWPQFPLSLSTFLEESDILVSLSALLSFSLTNPEFPLHKYSREKREQNKRRMWVSHSSCSIMRRICEIYWFFFGTVNCAIDEAHWLLLKRWKSHLFQQTGLKHMHWLQGFSGYDPVFPLTLAFPSWADIYPTHMLSVVWLHRNSTVWTRTQTGTFMFTDGK